MKFVFKPWNSLFLILAAAIFLISGCKEEESTEKPVPATVKDTDGNTYNTVKIGNQAWLKENLKATRYSNGIPIFKIEDNPTWVDFKDGAYCNYDNEADSIAFEYGRLYNWYAVVDSRNICPKGWHVPSNEEWQELVDNSGGDGVAGISLKESGYAHWDTSAIATPPTNDKGFNALPSGARVENGGYALLSSLTYWWSINSISNDYAKAISLSWNSNGTTRLQSAKYKGHSVRCIMDK